MDQMTRSGHMCRTKTFIQRIKKLNKFFFNFRLIILTFANPEREESE